jgi:membrane-bound ClpP family serine protease
MNRLLLAAALVTLFLGGGVAFVLAALSRHKKSAAGPLSLIGGRGRVLHELAPTGTVVIKGELLPARARNDQHLPAGAGVRVISANANGLEVELADEKRHL